MQRMQVPQDAEAGGNLGFPSGTVDWRGKKPFPAELLALH